MPRKIEAFHICHQNWLGLGFVNQTFDDEKTLTEDELERLLDNDDSQQGMGLPL